MRRVLVEIKPDVKDPKLRRVIEEICREYLLMPCNPENMENLREDLQKNLDRHYVTYGGTQHKAVVLRKAGIS